MAEEEAKREEGRGDKMRPSYGHDPGGSPIVPLLFLVVIAGGIGLHQWGDFKVSKMLPSYHSKPRVVNRVQSDHVKKLERKVASLMSRIESMKQEAPAPVERETEQEEEDRWKEQKGHLLERIAELEALLKANEEPYSDEDRDKLAAISKGNKK